MSQLVASLWTSREEQQLAALVAAVGRDDLLGALLAVEGAEPEAAEVTRAQLQRWGAGVRAMLPREGGATAERAAAALRDVLCEAGFMGDSQRYYALENSHLSRVVARRRGQPILLSSVWMLVGAEAGVAVSGIALPGHFIASVSGSGDQGGPRGGAVLVDPFAAGAARTIADCTALIEEVSSGTLSWDPAYLDPPSTSALVERVLRNVMNASKRAGDSARLYRAVRLLQALREDDPEVALLHAQLAENLGAVCLARQLYERIVARFATSCVCKAAQRRMTVVAEAEARLH